MKKGLAFLMLGFSLLTSPLFAQEEEVSEDCKNNYSIFYELYRAKAYAQAYDSWKYTYDSCAELTKNIYIFGPVIIKNKMKEAGSDEEKEKYINLLLETYDRRNELFPEREGYVIGMKAIDMLNYRPDEIKETYKLFEEAYKQDGYDHSAAFFNNFFNASIRMFNDKAFTLDEVFETFNIVSEAMELNNNILNKEIAEIESRRDSNGTLAYEDQKELAKFEKELERYNTVDANLEKQISRIATCSRLESLYNEETFAANKADTVWLRRAVKLLQKERTNDEGETESCVEMPIFFDIAAALYELEPSATAARSMGLQSFTKKDFEKASDYFVSAAEQELDPIKAGRDYNLAATAQLLQNNPSQAKNMAVKALKVRPDYGDAYITWAKAYAAADGTCGSNVFEKKSVYWAAIDKLKKAKSVDNSITEKANKLMSSYKSRVPDKSVSFQLGWTEGKTYTIGCWINETITVEFF